MTYKPLNEISWQVSEETYRNDPAYSYSTIAKFNREGFDKLETLFDKVESPALLFGSLVDTLLTDGEDAIQAKYEIAEFPKISDALIKISKDLFDLYSEEYRSLDLIPNDNVLSVIDQNSYQQNWKPETRVKVIKENCNEYYQTLSLSIGKTLVNNDDYRAAQQCVETLKTNNRTKWYFEPNNPFDNNIERFYQLKFKGTYNGIPLRCMMDECIVIHSLKLIIPIDLKTTGKKEHSFFHSFIDWQYSLQSNLYSYILRQNLDKDSFYKDYRLANYRFIVINKYNQKPLIWRYDDCNITNNIYYGKNKQFYCKNWRNIVPELHYYLTQKPEFPKGIKQINSIINWLNNE